MSAASAKCKRPGTLDRVARPFVRAAARSARFPRMLRRLLPVAALTLLSGLLLIGCEELAKGPDCCALKRFCTTCSTCTSVHVEAANKGEEATCSTWVEKFKAEKQFCNVNDAPPKHTIDEFVLQCEL
jgi:hypothetical protein